MKNFFLIQAVLALLLVQGLAAEGKRAGTTSDEPRASMRGDAAYESTRTLNDAAQVYKAVIDSSKGRVPESVRASAKCIAIFPRVTSAALAVGGSHGSGVAFCRNADNQWSNPAFVNINAGSIGLQAGVRQSEVVLFMTPDDSRARLQKGNITLGGELAAVGGSYDQDWSFPNKSVIAYSATEGVFAGAALNGTNLAIDRDEQRRFYGSEVRPFEGTIQPQSQKVVDDLRRLLPA